MKTLIRFHQLLWILVILSSCYVPDLKDCTVTCSGPGQCAGGQVCTINGFCVTEGGVCASGVALPGVDAGAPVERVPLHVQVMGGGIVEVVGATTCSGDCMIPVPRGTVRVTASSEDKEFERWTSPVCAGQPATCAFIIVAPTTIAAKFH